MKFNVALAGLLAAGTGWAADAGVRLNVENSGDGALARGDNRRWQHYKANELSFELFGMGTLGRSSVSDIAPDDIERDGNFGPGLGLTYFPHRNVGVQGEAYSDSSRGDHFVDAVGGHLVGRFPIGDNNVAPYIFAGAGRQFDPGPQWTWDAGGGFEWRFQRHIGVFIDGRFVWPDKSHDFGLGRLGFKFGF